MKARSRHSKTYCYVSWLRRYEGLMVTC